MTNDSGGHFAPGQPPGYPQQGWPGQFGPQPGYPPGYPPYQQVPQNFPPPPRGSKSPWPWIIGALVGAVILVIAGVTAVVLLKADSEPQEVAVTYEISGPPVEVEVSYWVEPGGNAVEVVALPWRKRVTMHGDNPFVSVSAMRETATDDPLRCRIEANGTTVFDEQSISRGVSCDGRVGEK